jgi:ribosome biogenesis GTPase A
MTKTLRAMQEDIHLVDLVIELADARIPRSSRNPEVDKLSQGRARVLLLGKSDLANEEENRKWLAFYKEGGLFAFMGDSRNNRTSKSLMPVIREACAEKIERNRKRGILNRPLRAMVIGIPNVGKSTFINSFTGKASAKTGDKPGVTKGKQWIRLNKEIELLDTPGILWPRIDDQNVGLNLAIVGSINDEILDLADLSVMTLKKIKAASSGSLTARYGIDESADEPEILKEIAQRRGCILPGGEPDTEKAAGIVVREFRSGVLGRITLEKADD